MNNMKQNQSNTSKSNKKGLEPMKYEIANEFGVELGPDDRGRANGSVGGEITKRLVSYAKGQMTPRG